MSSNITLSAAVRSNLLSLQNTASLLDTTQTRLATGNKVNSALDNPTNYFTASALNSRASDLGNLLDGVSNAIQTIQAANDGITSITKLVESAQATANQAQQLSETVTVAAAGGVNTGSIDLRDLSGPQAAVKTGGDVRDVTTATNAVNLGNIDVRDTTGATNAVNTGNVDLRNDTAATTSGTVDLSGLLTTAGVSSGNSLSITIGGVTKTIAFNNTGVAGGADAAVDLDGANDATDTTDDATGAQLIAAINGAFGGATPVASIGTGGVLVLTAQNTTDTITSVSGTAATALVGATGAADAGPTSSGLAGLQTTTGSLTVAVGSSGPLEIDLSAVNDQDSLLTAVNNALGVKGTATIDSTTGFLKVTAANTTDSVTFGGTSSSDLSAIGVTTTAAAPGSSTSNSIINGLTKTAGSLTVKVGTANAAAVDLTGVSNQATLLTALNNALGSTGTASVDSTTGFLKITAANNTDSVTYGGTAAGDLSALGVTSTAAAPGSSTTNAAVTGLTDTAAGSLTVKVGSGNATTVDLTGVTNQATLLTAVNNALGSAATATIDSTTGHLKITAANTTDSVTVGGTSAADIAALGLDTTAAAPTTGSGNPTIAGLTGNLTIKVGTGTATAVDLTGVTDDASLLTAVNTALGSKGTASIDATTGHLTVKATAEADSVTWGGDAGNLSALGVTTTAANPTTASTTANPARAALISQYNGLLDQIDNMTADANYNGNNLLGGTNAQLKVVFNEAGTSTLTVTGKDTSATGLGLSRLSAGTEFDTNTSITGILASLKTATDTLRTDASSFGSNLSIVQTRQDFTKALINTLQTGASNLTLADSNEEAANLLALQTRQSLSTKALSLASQSDQNVLRLLQ
jgi:flagellin-like hook-associated protein FlgL